MSKSQNNNIFVWIGLCILLILPNIARTQSVKLYVTDSLTEESVTNYSVYIDDSIVFPSFDETHVAHLVLDKDILDEEFMRNLPADEKYKAIKYNSRIMVTVAEDL